MLADRNTSDLFLLIGTKLLDTLKKIGAVAYQERSKQVYATEAAAALSNHVRQLESVCETRVSEE